jgi:ubiquinone/menaquinone biosynthesis C-methylase UbiE
VKIRSHVQPTDVVLELGTGTGDIALHVAPYGKNVVGIDIDPEMIAIANRKKSEQNHDNISFQDGDAYDLPFAGDSFDKGSSLLCLNVPNSK